MTMTLSIPTVSIPTTAAPVSAADAIGARRLLAFSEVREARRERTLLGVAVISGGIAMFAALIAVAILAV
jgi:hypothetical protein